MFFGYYLLVLPFKSFVWPSLIFFLFTAARVSVP